MSEIQRWDYPPRNSCVNDLTRAEDGIFVLYTDHLAAIEALKAPFADVSPIKRYSIDWEHKELKPTEHYENDFSILLVKEIDHLRYIAALKDSYEAVPVSMREHAEAMVKELNDSMNQDGVTDSAMIRTVESYLDKHFIGVAEKDDTTPYFGWCDVEGCENEGCSGGFYWRETGYWTICYEHANQCRKGIQQPKMKKEAVEREKSRLPNGNLPTEK